MCKDLSLCQHCVVFLHLIHDRLDQVVSDGYGVALSLLLLLFMVSLVNGLANGGCDNCLAPFIAH